jgi:hypothetical protein
MLFLYKKNFFLHFFFAYTLVSHFFDETIKVQY